MTLMLVPLMKFATMFAKRMVGNGLGLITNELGLGTLPKMKHLVIKINSLVQGNTWARL